jgi:hypothetical protein
MRWAPRSLARASAPSSLDQIRNPGSIRSTSLFGSVSIGPTRLAVRPTCWDPMKCRNGVIWAGCAIEVVGVWERSSRRLAEQHG